MKVSIWQQYSSNHSSLFTVVGEFASRTDAEKAATTIRNILKRIADWIAAHYGDEFWEDEFWTSGQWAEQPTPIEQEIADEYGITWPGAIDWSYDPKIDSVLDRLLYIRPESQADSDGRPFDQLMNRLGGRGYLESTSIDGGIVGCVVFDLTCTAPDAATADALYGTYLGYNRRIKRKGSTLHFYRWRFDEHPDLPTLIDRLRDAACQDIEYSFTQVDPEKMADLFDQSDLEVMLDILQRTTDNNEQYDAMELLGEIGDERAVEALIPLLQSSENWLRRTAAVALGKIGEPRALEPLRQALSTADERTRPVIEQAIRAIEEPKA